MVTGLVRAGRFDVVYAVALLLVNCARRLCYRDLLPVGALVSAAHASIIGFLDGTYLRELCPSAIEFRPQGSGTKGGGYCCGSESRIRVQVLDFCITSAQLLTS